MGNTIVCNTDDALHTSNTCKVDLNENYYK